MTDEFKVIAPPNLPPEMHGAYARSVIEEAEARRKAEQAFQQAQREKQELIETQLAQVEKENAAKREKEAEEAEKRAEKDFDAAIKRAYFEANPGASELDWLRDKKTFKSEAMISRALDQLEGRDSSDAIMMESLLKSGRYRSF